MDEARSGYAASGPVVRYHHAVRWTGRGKSSGRSYPPLRACGGRRASAWPLSPLRAATVDSQPQLSAQDLLDQLRARFEQLCHDVAGAVNQAPAGHVINASEE